MKFKLHILLYMLTEWYVLSDIAWCVLCPGFLEPWRILFIDWHWTFSYRKTTQSLINQTLEAFLCSRIIEVSDDVFFLIWRHFTIFTISQQYHQREFSEGSAGSLLKMTEIPLVRCWKRLAHLYMLCPSTQICQKDATCTGKWPKKSSLLHANTQWDPHQAPSSASKVN